MNISGMECIRFISAFNFVAKDKDQTFSQTICIKVSLACNLSETLNIMAQVSRSKNFQKCKTLLKPHQFLSVPIISAWKIIEITVMKFSICKRNDSRCILIAKCFGNKVTLNKPTFSA